MVVLSPLTVFVSKGTTFTIYMPKHGVSTISPDKLDKKLIRGDEHILFVDDEPEITFMGKKMLENLGYKVTIKSDSHIRT